MNQKRTGTARVAASAAAVLLLAACGAKRDVAVDRAWVRLPAVAGNPAAAYFTLHGGSTPAILLKVATPAAARAELHESMTGMHNMTTMAPLKQVEVPTGADTGFAPGGRHVMLYDVSPTLKPGDAALLTFAFADGRTLETEAKVVGAGDPAP